ncbi:hypothetical protein [Caproiciproducens galactitolivorans]|uniref:Uncharacterized protein n=1 Tax=Caproiciproducens galactitolivorans TaxID=642589 RepID=A0ABT4BV01_9FIRM|nr:hypothetical protein [Caproiciproducens galactitolivorans]MCY1714630.1 hypothetical protein [Caproiciproducens galactitolivorans]
MTTQKINENKSKKEDEGRKRKWLYILGILLLLLLLRSCGNQHPCPNPPPSSSVPSSSAPSLDDTGSAEPGNGSTPSRQEILSRLQKQEVTVTDKVSAQASFSSGAKGSTGIWEVENPASNTVIMQCEITLNGELLDEWKGQQAELAKPDRTGEVTSGQVGPMLLGPPGKSQDFLGRGVATERVSFSPQGGNEQSEVCNDERGAAPCPDAQRIYSPSPQFP